MNLRPMVASRRAVDGWALTLDDVMNTAISLVDDQHGLVGGVADAA